MHDYFDFYIKHLSFDDLQLQVVHPTFPFNPQVPVVPATAPPTQDDMELAMAINASLQTATQQRPPHLGIPPVSVSGPGASSSITNFVDASVDQGSHAPGASSPKKGYNIQEASTSTVANSHVGAQPILENSVPASVPSAPIADEIIHDDGSIHYPQIDATLPLDMSQHPLESSNARAEEKKDAGTSSCVICLDAPVEGACIPCGHMAGCMSCLNEIKAKKWGCPVCRAKIDQVVRLYAV